MEVKMINNRPVKIWTDNVEESAMRQIENLTTLPFLFHHLAIMPDVHAGMGMPIGGVLACEDAVIPNAVGVDIGCGMCAKGCPAGCITRTDYIAPGKKLPAYEIDKSKCIKCGVCMNNCRLKAIVRK